MAEQCALPAPPRCSDAARAIGITVSKLSEWLRNRLSAEMAGSYDEKVRRWLMRRRDEESGRAQKATTAQLVAQQVAQARRAAAGCQNEAENGPSAQLPGGVTGVTGETGVTLPGGGVASTAGVEMDHPEMVALAEYIIQCGGTASMLAGFTTAWHVRRSGKLASANYHSFVGPPNARGKTKNLRSKADVARYLGLVPLSQDHGKPAGGVATDAASVAMPGEAGEAGAASAAGAAGAAVAAGRGLPAAANSATSMPGAAGAVAGAASTAGSAATAGKAAPEEELSEFLQEEL